MIEYDRFIDSVENSHNITVVVDRDCTIRCTYCYLDKAEKTPYDSVAVLKSLDILLEDMNRRAIENDDDKGVILEFYPEPWVDIKRTDHLIRESLKLLLKYPALLEKYNILLATNGYYLNKPIPIFEEILTHASLAVTVDGTKEQHDMYRLTKNGRGTWDRIVGNVKKYQDKYGIHTTKVTLGPDTIKFMFDACMYLWFDLGLTDIWMNVVFEDLWGDRLNECVEEYDKQLKKLADYVIENKMWEKRKHISLLGNRNIPRRVDLTKVTAQEFTSQTFCGAAKMRSIDSDGQVYPCIRLAKFALGESPFVVDKNDSLDGHMRALNLLNDYDATPEKCMTCPLLANCAMCVGNAYDETDSIFWRTTHHCEFMKLNYKYSLIVRNAMNGIIE